MPDPVISRAGRDPESDAMLADSVGLALFIVLKTLEPAARIEALAVSAASHTSCRESGGSRMNNTDLG